MVIKLKGFYLKIKGNAEIRLYIDLASINKYSILVNNAMTVFFKYLIYMKVRIYVPEYLSKPL